MAGTPANMTVAPYKDTDVSHDHTYYGKGCKNAWSTSGDEGSQTPCIDSDAGGRIIKDGDDQDQKNGTLYHNQAATSGSGGTISTDNTNAPDTFCPLGWQLPYSGKGGDYYDKSKSWIFLFTTYNISFNTGTAIDINKIKMYPLSYIYSGYYYWGLGRLYYQGSVGYYWSQTIVGSASAYGLDTWSGAIRPSDIASRSFGFPLRCVKFLASHHRRHGGRNRCKYRLFIL